MKLRYLSFLGLLLALVSCQAISTKDQQTVNTPFPDASPSLIVVRDFETGKTTLRRDANDGDLMRQITGQISSDLYRNFKSANFNTEQLPSGQSAGSMGWVVTGRIRLVQWSNINDNPDDRSSSNDRIECTAYVYDVSKSRVQPFMTFDVSVPRLAGEDAKDQDASLKSTCDSLSKIVVRNVQNYIHQNF